MLCLPRSATSAISDLPINAAHFNDKNEVILDGTWQVYENYNLIEQGEAVPTFLTRTVLDWQALGIVQKYPKGTHLSLRYFLKGLPSRKHGYALFARFHLPSLIKVYPLGGKSRSFQARVGFPARDFQSEGYGYGIKMVPFVSEGPDQVWVFEIFQSNYRPLYGGSPEFKVLPGELLERELTSPVFSDIICLGSLLILGLYNFMIYFNFRRDITALTLGLTCFASSLRVVGSSYWLRQTYLYKESWEQVAGVLEYLSIFIAPLFFVLYVAHLFPKTLPKILRNGIVGLFLLACATILVYFDRPFQYLTYYQLVLVVGIIFGVLIPLVRASLFKIPGARFILISSALPLFTIGTDILISQGILNWPYLTGYSMTLFFLLQSHLVGSRLSDSYNRVYALNSELTEGNNKNLALIGELKKLIYPHQVTMITENKSRLEETMPTGKHLAACISFDIQSSSTLGHSENYTFFESVLKRCHRVMMSNYDPHSLNAHAYMIKEMGDGFLCSVGFPFTCDGDVGQVTMDLCKQFIQVFKEAAEVHFKNRPVYCAVGLAYGQVNGYFQKTGLHNYELYGDAIVKATRYESFRKVLFEQGVPKTNILIAQQQLVELLPKDEQASLERFPLTRYKVRDDSQAEIAFYRTFP